MVLVLPCFYQMCLNPRHGKLFYTSQHQWIFCPGKTCDLAKGIELVNLLANFQHLLDTGQLFCGHKKLERVYQTRNQVQLQDCILHHVSVHGLQSLIAPTSIHKHALLSPHDDMGCCL